MATYTSNNKNSSYKGGGGYQGGYKWCCDITESNIDTAKNTSQVTAKVYMVKTGVNKLSYNMTGSAYIELTINGQTFKETTKFDMRNSKIGTTQVLITKTITVPHNSDGSKKISFHARHWTSIIAGSPYAQVSADNVVLTTINRKSTFVLDASSFNIINVSPGIKVTCHDKSFIHVLEYSIPGSDVARLETNSIKTNGSWTYIPIPSSWKDLVKPQQSVTMTIKLHTKTKDGVWFGVDTKTITAKNNNPIDVPGVLSIDTFWIQSDTYTENNKYISGKTAFKLYTAYTSNKGVKEIIYTISGANSQTTTVKLGAGSTGSKSHTWTSAVMNNPGEVTIVVTVVDNTNKRASRTTVQTLYAPVVIQPKPEPLPEPEPVHILTLDELWVTGINLEDGNFVAGQSSIKVNSTYTSSEGVRSINYTVKGALNQSNTVSLIASSKANSWTTNTIRSTGHITITATLTDLKGETVSKVVSLTAVEPYNPVPEKPVITIEETYKNLTLSEGVRVSFKGASSNLKNYKIIIAHAPCDLFKANESYDYTKGLMTCPQERLSSILLSNTKTSKIEYITYKDFGDDGTDLPIRYTSGKFYMYPKDVVKYYMLQWVNNIKPGDTTWIYVIEREYYKGQYYYSDEPLKKPIINTMTAMCTLPLCTPKLEIELSELDKYHATIKYKNPLYNALNKPTFLLDICLIAKDENGTVLKGPSTGKRDGLNGRTWINYSDRKWHNLTSKENDPLNNKEIFTMNFDLSSYPDNTQIAIVGFYYPNYKNYPSIYSTTNIVQNVTNTYDIGIDFINLKDNEKLYNKKQHIEFELKLIDSVVDPTNSHIGIYDSNLNTINNFTLSKWNANPIIFNVNRTNDKQVPFFKVTDLYKDNNNFAITAMPYCDTSDKYSLNKKLYTDLINNENITIPAPDVIEPSIFYRDYDIYLVNTENLNINSIDTEFNCIEYLSPLSIDELIYKGKMPFTYDNKEGEMLNLNKNNLMVLITPFKQSSVLYRKNISVELFGTVFRHKYINPLKISDIVSLRSYLLEKEAQYNANSYILNGAFKDAMLSVKEFSLDYWKNVNDIIVYERQGRPDFNLENQCYLSFPSNNEEYCIYQEIDSYLLEKGSNIEISYDLYRYNTNVNVKALLEYVANGAIIYTEDISSNNTDKELSIKSKKITTISDKEYDTIRLIFKFTGPNTYSDEIIRLGNVIISKEIPWRELTDKDYLMARDFNDTRQFCIDLFKRIDINSNLNNINYELFESLEIIEENDVKGLNDYSPISGTYFTEWEYLIEHLNRQGQ